MRLPNARLCLDCDEVHDQARCPVCASESFAFIKRWIKTPEKRTPPQVPTNVPSETLDTYRALLDGGTEPRTAVQRLLRGGAVSLAVFGVAGWMFQRSLRKKDTKPSGPSTT